jgi:Chitobiase/beta-hexosaminidase C-terminal domain
MKLSRQKREELSSATITQALALVFLCSGLFALTAYATNPSWWSSPGTGTQGAVVAEQVVTNDGVVSTNYITNDYAIVVQGQLKQFTARAVDELNSNLTGGAGTNLNNLVHGWAEDYATNGYNATNREPSDYTAMTASQLKYVGNMVWTRLVAGGYTNALPAWLDTNSSDTQMANLGQLKQVFDFNLSGLFAATPTFSPAAGTYSSTQTVAISSTTSGATIYYTTDGGRKRVGS